jgi:CcmD family protein
MNIQRKLALIGLLLLTAFTSQAQESGVEMATEMRASGKIYVVVAVLVIIFVGIVIYLINLDKKISKLEKENKK